MNDEAVVLLGHLVGLNCIDANLCMKGDDLDNQVRHIVLTVSFNRRVCFLLYVRCFDRPTPYSLRGLIYERSQNLILETQLNCIIITEITMQ